MGAFTGSITGWLGRRPLLTELGLVALTVLFGLQGLRVLVPGLSWTVVDRLDLNTPELGLVALIIFLVAFLAGAVRRWLGEGRAIIITATGLSLLRLLMQPFWGEPLINIGLAMLATMLFVLFIPLSLGRARRSGTTGQFALGLLLGLSFDTAIHGVYGTYDTVWQSGLLVLLPTLLLVAVQWLLLASYIRTQPEAGADALDVNPWPLLAIGPFFFLELLIFQNIARLAVLTNLVLPAAFAWTLLGHLLALWIATQLLKKPGNLRFPLVIAGGLLLVAVTTLSDAAAVWLIAAALLIGQLTLSILMVAIIMDLGGSSGKAHRSLTAPFGAGMVLLVVLLLGYYASYQISLPFSNTVLPPLAALVMAVCGGLSSRKLSPVIQMKSRLRVVAMLAVPLMLLPLITFGIWQTPGVESGSGYPLRIMTYNLHNGFNTDGRLDMEALARVIEESNPDVVALQEISRGWLISGRLDMLTWLSQRLEMPYISGPTADSLWGNAILSNFPILEYANYELPPRDLPIKRGFTAALIDIGDGQILQVVANHFHHPEEGSAIRQVQSDVIVDFYSGVGSVVYLGDFNAEPDTTEMEMLRNAGLVDSLAGRDDLTFNSDDLYQRIDYIWVSADLIVLEAYVPFSNASDHLAVVAVIDR